MLERIKKNTLSLLQLLSEVFQKRISRIETLLEKRFPGKQKRFIIPSLLFLPIITILFTGIVLINSYIDKECRTIITTLVEEKLDRKITIGESSFGLTNINFQDITVFETINGEKSLVSIDSIDIYPDFLEYLLTSKASLSKVVINDPKLTLALGKDGNYNIPELNGEVLVTLKDVLQFFSTHQELTIDEMNIAGGLVVFQNDDPRFPLESFTLTNVQGGLSDFFWFTKVCCTFKSSAELSGKNC